MDWKALAAFPSTNGRILTSILLATFYVVVALVADLAGHPLAERTLDTIGLFIIGWMTADVVQFVGKRKTQHEPKP